MPGRSSTRRSTASRRSSSSSAAIVLYDAIGLEDGFADQPVQPYAIPYVVGAVLVVLGVLLAVATARGDRARGRGGRGHRPHPGHRPPHRRRCWPASSSPTSLLIDWLGWAITGALLFAGCAGVLGSRSHVRDLALGAALSVGSWYGFYVGLGIPIPAGILDGVL